MPERENIPQPALVSKHWGTGKYIQLTPVQAAGKRALSTVSDLALVSPKSGGMIVPLPSDCENLREDQRMAKQKLTPEKRAILRKVLAAKVKAGMSRSEILNSLSAQFGITTEGMRWYYKDATGTKKPKKAASAAKSKPASGPRPAFKAQKKALRKAAAVKPSQNGSSLHLPEILKHSEGELRRILAAKKLVPHLEAATRREQELRRSVKRLSRELRTESTKARKLQRQIQRLARV